MTNHIKSFFKYKLSRWWYNYVKCLFFPQQQWARKVIPRTWSDVDDIFTNVLFAGLIFFWEKDGGGESLECQCTAWDDVPIITPEERASSNADNKRIYDILLAAYNWAKIREAEFDKEPYDYHHEERLHDLDTQHLKNIIEYRRYLWT